MKVTPRPALDEIGDEHHFSFTEASCFLVTPLCLDIHAEEYEIRSE
jgi:hypothetical protein